MMYVKKKSLVVLTKEQIEYREKVLKIKIKTKPKKEKPLFVIKIDKTGMVFGRLTVVRFHSLDKHRHKKWLCVCVCGNETIVYSACLTSGKTISCGCFRMEMVKKSNKKHGLCHRIREYGIWTTMRSRCNNPKNPNYKRYGGRGIKVCDRWNDFELFFKDVGEAPSLNHSLDRYPDMNGDYEPKNFRWATKTEQSNNRRDNKNITHNEMTLSHAAWARELNVSVHTIRYHVNIKKAPFSELYERCKISD